MRVHTIHSSIFDSDHVDAFDLQWTETWMTFQVDGNTSVSLGTSLETSLEQVTVGHAGRCRGQ